jgi:hypothetical protein
MAAASVGSESRRGAGGGATVARRAASASACVVRPSARLAEMAASRAEAIADRQAGIFPSRRRIKRCR